MKNEQMAAELENFVSANWRNSYRDAAAVDRLKGATK